MLAVLCSERIRMRETQEKWKKVCLNNVCFALLRWYLLINLSFLLLVTQINMELRRFKGMTWRLERVCFAVIHFHFAPEAGVCSLYRLSFKGRMGWDNSHVRKGLN